MACHRINGAMIPNYIGKDVILVGSFLNMNNTNEGTSIKVRCCDDPIIMCVVKPAVNDYIEADSLLEIWGKPTSRHAINVTHFKVFSEEEGKNFDRKLYNEAISTIHGTAAKNQYYIDDVTEHHGAGEDIELINGDAGKQQVEENFMAA